jgi:hypothetical protein
MVDLTTARCVEQSANSDGATAGLHRDQDGADAVG